MWKYMMAFAAGLMVGVLLLMVLIVGIGGNKGE